MPTDRENLEAVAKGYHDLEALRRQQRETTATLIRACVARLNTNTRQARVEAMTALTSLADMLERK